MRKIVIILSVFVFQFAFSQDFEKDEDLKPVPYNSVAIKPLGVNDEDYIVSFSKWVGKYIIYPAIAIEEEIQEVVHVSYAIDKEGRTSQIEIINDVHPELRKEVKRTILASPRILSGKDSLGNPVPVLMKAKVHFVLIAYNVDSIKYVADDSVNLNIKVVGYGRTTPHPQIVIPKPVKGIRKIWYRIKSKIRKK